MKDYNKIAMAKIFGSDKIIAMAVLSRFGGIVVYMVKKEPVSHRCHHFHTHYFEDNVYDASYQIPSLNKLEGGVA